MDLLGLGIDPQQLLGLAGTVIGLAIGYFATNPRAQRLLKVGQRFIELGDAYFEGAKDKTFTESEYAKIGKEFVNVIREISDDEDIPELELKGV